MSAKKFIFPALLVSSVAALIYRLFTRAFAEPASAKPVTDCGSYEEIDAYIKEQMHRLNIPGVSLAIVEGGKIVHLRGFGKARPGGEAPTPQTPFFIGSLTKSLTALAVMQLVEAGKVELDAPVQRYLPWFRVADPQASAEMTVRHLLNQTSGLPMMLGMADLANLDSRPDAAERQMRALSTLKLTRPVGSRFEYTNANYNVLGLIIETASGESYSDYVQRHIFDPLDMSHTFTSKAEAKQNGLAMGHRYWFGHPFPAANLSMPPASLPSGQLISSAEDMAHYLIAQLTAMVMRKFSRLLALMRCTARRLRSTRWAGRLDIMAWVGLARKLTEQESSGTAASSLTLERSWLWCRNKRKASFCSLMPTTR